MRCIFPITISYNITLSLCHLIQSTQTPHKIPKVQSCIEAKMAVKAPAHIATLRFFRHCCGTNISQFQQSLLEQENVSLGATPPLFFLGCSCHNILDVFCDFSEPVQPITV